jgi:hypothetical protein
MAMRQKTMGRTPNQQTFSLFEELPEKGAEGYNRGSDDQGVAGRKPNQEDPVMTCDSYFPAALSLEDIEANKLRATNLYFAKPMYDLIAKADKEPYGALDHHTLFMHAFEFIHRHLGLGTHEQGGVTREELSGHLVALMERQFSALESKIAVELSDRSSAKRYATDLVEGLLNAGKNSMFELRVFNPAKDTYESKDFMLLREVDTWDNKYLIRPTTQGVNLYLNLLPRTIENTEIALEAILREQIKRGQIPDAVGTAGQWRLAAFQYREDIFDFRRNISLNIGSVSWVNDVEPKVGKLIEDVGSNRRKVDDILESVETNPKSIPEFVELRRLLRECQYIYHELDSLVIGLNRFYLTEHAKQRFLPISPIRMPNMAQEVLVPLLKLSPHDLHDDLLDMLITCLSGPTAPPVVDMDLLLSKAMAPRREIEQYENAGAEPEFVPVEESVVKFISESEIRRAREIISIHVTSSPIRLSDLLAIGDEETVSPGVLYELALTAIESWRSESAGLGITGEKTGHLLIHGDIVGHDYLLRRLERREGKRGA